MTKGITEILLRERDMADDSNGWIFPTSKTKSGHLTSLAKSFTRCVERAVIVPEMVVPHIMRHTAISRLAETGADLKTLQEFSGHLSVSMVHRYTHAQVRTIDLALDRMESRTIVEHPQARQDKES